MKTYGEADALTTAVDARPQIFQFVPYLSNIKQRQRLQFVSQLSWCLAHSTALLAGGDVTGFPAPGWRVHPVEAQFAVSIARDMPTLPPALDAEINRIWVSAQAVSGGALFNGRVFSTDDITPTSLRGHWTEYRRVIAQMERPELFEVLALRPTSTGGVLTCADGVVFGRRPDNAVYQAGLWQMPPAGSIDTAAARGDGSIDVLSTLFMELAEELGLERSVITATRLLCLAEHPANHVLDLGIALHTQMDGSALLAAHAARANGEYTALRIVPPANLGSFLAALGDTVTPQAHAFLVVAGFLPPPPGATEDIHSVLARTG